MAIDPALLDIPPSPLDEPPIIHGLETLDAPAAAIGAAEASSAPPDAAPSGAPAAQGEPPKPVRIQDTPEFKARESELYKRWEATRLDGARQQERDRADQERLELAQRAVQDDPEALAALGKDQATQLLSRYQNERGLKQAMVIMEDQFAETLNRVAGDNAEIRDRLNPMLYQSVPDWFDAVRAVERENAIRDADREREGWKEAARAEARAETRGQMPIPDLTPPVTSLGQVSPRKWTTYAEAATLFNLPADDPNHIDAREMEMASTWFSERRIKFGELGTE